MRIVIDMQGAQAQSRNRGIGRYTLAMVRALVRQSRGHELILVLNGQFTDTLTPLQDEFGQWLPQSHIRVWKGPGTVHQLDEGNRVRWQVAEVIYEHFLASLKPDCVLVTSLFEGIGDDAVTSIGRWGTRLPVACVLYDLIPLIYPDLYLDNPAHKRWYLEKLDHLRRSDLLLAISESSRQESINHLSWSEADVVNIASAAEYNFCRLSISSERHQVLKNHYGLQRPFVMYTGGIDHRKNVDRLIAAFAALPEELRSRHQLAIVCAVHDSELRRLQSLARQYGMNSDDLVLTGFIPEHDLVELYNLCELFVFPSIHEGFGLPALEAMCCGAPVIGSDRSSLPEVIGTPEALFNPESITDMAALIERSLTDSVFREFLMDHGRTHAQSFSWDATARAVVRAVEQKFEPGVAERAPAPDTERPDLAMVSPLPPQRSGISDYTIELLEELEHYYDITLVSASEGVELPDNLQHLPVMGVEQFRKTGLRFDRVLYQFGNSEFHQHMFALLQEIPGVVVLHDFYLSGVLAWDEVHGSRSGLWQASLLNSHGYGPLVELAEGTELADVIWRYPASLEVIQQAQRVIVHSPTSRRLAESWYGPGAADHFAHIPLLRQPASAGDDARGKAREQLGIADGDVVVCSFGFLGATKLNHELVQAWSQTRMAGEGRAMLVFVGGMENDPYADRMRQLIAQSPDPDRIRITGWVSMEEYRQYLDAADIGVQLRTRSRGETSASVLDCLNYGLATVVNANGSMADLPPSVVRRLPDEFAVTGLAGALDELYQQPDLRAALSSAGRQLIVREHSPARCARAYRDVIEAGHSDPANRSGPVIDHIAGIFAQHPGVEPFDQNPLVADIDWDFPQAPRIPVLMVDVTDQHDGAQSQPVSTKVLRDWLRQPPSGFHVAPVWFDRDQSQYRHANQWAAGHLAAGSHTLADEPVSFAPGDSLLGLDLSEATRDQLAPRYQMLRQYGVFARDGINLAGVGSRADVVASTLVSVAARHTAAASAEARLLVDVSELVRQDAGTGIQRVVKQVLQAWFRSPPGGRQVCPVYAGLGAPGYLHANRFAMNMDQPGYGLVPDVPVSYRTGDVFVGLDLQPSVVAANAPVYEDMRRAGVSVWFVLYDLIAVTQPDYFLPGAEDLFSRWLRVVTQSDGIVSISAAVRDELTAWIREHNPGRLQSLETPWFHLGADPVSQGEVAASPDSLPQNLTLTDAPSFLMVGTIEPRKGHAQALAAFEHLWNEGHDYRLVILGRKGWLVDDLVDKLARHPELGKRLFWLDSASDQQLWSLYSRSQALLACSWAEGFGLPLIEAARHGLPLVVRDIPVFREVAGDHASYFQADTPEALADHIKGWLERFRNGEHPDVAGMSWLGWEESARALAECLGLGDQLVSASLLTKQTETNHS